MSIISDSVYCKDGYSFPKNNCYSIYLDNIIDDHALNVNGLLNRDRSNTHVHNTNAKT